MEPSGPVQACNGIALHFFALPFTVTDFLIAVRYEREKCRHVT